MYQIIFKKFKKNLYYLFWSLCASSVIADPIVWNSFLENLETVPIKERQKQVDLFLEHYKKKLPLVENQKVIFLYQGTAQHVFVAGDFNNWEPNLVMKKILGTNLYYATTEFPLDARFEYKYVVDGNWQLDSFNSQVARGGYGQNSDLSMPEYQSPQWFSQPIAKHKGKIEEFSIKSKVLKNTRKLRVYTPFHYNQQQKYPLMIVHDGNDYIHLAYLNNLLDYLIEKQQIAPMIIAYIDPVMRNREYACSQQYKKFTKTELIPFLEKNFSIDKNRNKRIFAGASMGGLVSFFLAHELKDDFGGAICQSGAFVFPQMPSQMSIDTTIKKFCKKIQFDKLRTTKLWLDCGNIGPLEQFLLKGNRHLHKLLTENKIAHHYSEVNEAHNWKNWAKQMEKALPYMFTE